MIQEPGHLAELMAKKLAVTAGPPPAEAASGGATRTLTLRIPVAADEQLRELAAAARRPQHALLVEAIDLLFERHGRPLTMKAARSMHALRLDRTAPVTRRRASVRQPV